MMAKSRKPTITERRITDYLPDNENANSGSPRGLDSIETSLQQLGAGRSLVADRNGRLIAGNQTQQAAVNAGIERVIEIETEGDTLIVHKRKDLDLDTMPRARALAIADNRTQELSLTWDDSRLAPGLQSLYEDSPKLLEAAGFYADEIPLIEDPPLKDDYLTHTPITRWDVPDALYASDNEWGIPLLDIEMQAQQFDAPFAIWGEAKRTARISGTWLFYTDDYRFESLWSDPSPIVNTGCVNAVEPNFSVFRHIPVAVALWHIYRKRWLARYWQSQGIRIFVDLNVPDPHFALNWLGVPKKWKAYMTRGYNAELNGLDEEYDAACQHAETGSILYVVYGGGKHVKAHCEKRGWLWLRETMNARRNGKEQ